MTVAFFFRTRSGLYSIERVFETVAAALSPEVRVRRYYSRCRRGPFGLLYNLMEARARRSEVNHITGDVHYLALVLPGKRTVLTVHDCGTLHRLAGWRREVARRLWFDWPARRAGAVTVISGETRRELLRFTACPESKIRVVPDPLPPAFSACPRPFSRKTPKLLQIGARPNKNLENVVRALEGMDVELTIVGHLSAEQTDLLGRCGVRYTAAANLSDEQMLDAYRETDMVVFCSTYEGFGLPIIEANAIGRPVVTSDIEPLRTVANGAACLVNPEDVGSIREGIRRIIADEQYREALLRAGFANAERFRAEKIASMYEEVYRNLIAADSPSRGSGD